MKKKIQQPKEYSRIRRNVSFAAQNNQQYSATVVYKDKRRGFRAAFRSKIRAICPYFTSTANTCALITTVTRN